MQNQISSGISTIFSTFFVALSLVSPLRALEPIEQNSVREPLVLSQIATKSYISEEGQFEVRLPGQPETRTRTISIAGQSTEWNVFLIQEDANFYAVAYTDLTPKIIELGANKLIDSIKNNLAKEFNWSNINNYGKGITVNGYPSRELIGTQNNQLSVLRLIMANPRLYAVMSSSEELENIGQFIDSFTVQPWQVFVSEEGGFSVDLPMPPTDETESIELGETEFNWKVIEARNFQSPEDDSYAVAYTDVSSEDLQQGADALLERVGKNLIQKIQPQAIIESGKAIVLQGNPGRSFVVATQEDQIAAIHFYLVNQRLYGVGARAEDITNLSRFLKSFQIQ